MGGQDSRSSGRDLGQRPRRSATLAPLLPWDGCAYRKGSSQIAGVSVRRDEVHPDCLAPAHRQCKEMVSAHTTETNVCRQPVERSVNGELERT